MSFGRKLSGTLWVEEGVSSIETAQQVILEELGGADNLTITDISWQTYDISTFEDPHYRTKGISTEIQFVMIWQQSEELRKLHDE